jgi:Haem-binding domain
MESSPTIPSVSPPLPKKRSLLKRVSWWLLFILLAIQFFQPGKNNQSMDMTYDISTVVAVPDSVKWILKTACYDCHSNFTNYPWYSNIQPAGWWLKDHIEEGKSQLNFQEFALLKPRPGDRFKTPASLQSHLLEEIAESQTEGWMPLKSYTFIHKEARLSETQRRQIVQWVDSALVQLKKIDKPL